MEDQLHDLQNRFEAKKNEHSILVPENYKPATPYYAHSPDDYDIAPKKKKRLKFMFKKKSKSKADKEEKYNADDLFQEKYEALTIKLDEIRVRLEELEKVSATRVQNIMTSEKAPLSNRANELRNEIREMTNSFHSNLMELSHKVSQFEYMSGGESSKRMKKMLLAGLSEEFRAMYQEFDEIQTQAGEQYSRVVEHQLRVVDPELSIAEDEQPSELLLSYLLTDNLTEEGLRILNERHYQLRSVEQELVELHQLSIAMSEFVMQQGENIEAIEKYVNQTKISLDDANANLRSAYSKRKKIRRKKALLVAVIASSFVSLGAVLAGFVMAPL